MQDSLHALILDALAEGVLTIDHQGLITSFNRAMAGLTGVSPGEALGRPYTEVIRSDSCRSVDLLRQTLESHENLHDMACALVDRSDAVVPIIVNTAVVRAGSEVVGAVATFRDNRTVELLRAELHERACRYDIVSKNPRMRALLDLVPDIAASASTVLIQGATGTGKEVLARAIHGESARAERPFVALNCGALPDALLESELFGYKKGAFTDATADKPGRFALAEGGTLFLDEIGEISQAMQVKLLRVLQERVYEPLGATASVATDVRVIAATNRHLLEEVSAGRFRADLFYRLNVMPLELPTLAERREDLPLLVDHFICTFNAQTGRALRGISEDALRLLLRYDYPGNIRELENVIEHAFVVCKGDRIEPGCLPGWLHAGTAVQAPSQAPPAADDPTPSDAGSTDLAARERRIVFETLERHGGNKGATARELGIHPTTLWRKLKKWGRQ